jgi:hypothetical protein
VRITLIILHTKRLNWHYRKYDIREGLPVNFKISFSTLHMHKFRATGHQERLILDREASYFQRNPCTFFLTYQQRISVHIQRAQSARRRCGHSRNNGPQYGTRFTSPFWRLEFGRGSLIFVIFAAPGHSHHWLLF